MHVDMLTLPPEILCRIFLCLSRQSPCTFGTTPFPTTQCYDSTLKREKHGWFPPVMQTCRTWREIALADPELWATNICAFRYAEATDCFLKRAKGSQDLVFALNVDGEPGRLTKRQIQRAGENIGRVRVFSHDGPIKPMSASFARSLFSAPLPNLRILRMGRWPGAGDAFVIDNITLHAPALQELYLDSLFFPINTPNLRTLNVKKETHLFQPAVPVSLLLSTLRTAPLLEKLALIQLVIATSDQNAKHSGKHVPINDVDVELPCLRFLCLDASSRVPHFYRHVKAASDADVQITDNYHSTELPAMFAAMERHMCDPRYDMLIVHEVGNRLQLCMRSSASDKARHADQGKTSKDQLARLPKPNFLLNMQGGWDEQRIDTLLALRHLMPHIESSNIMFLDLGHIGGSSHAPIGVNDLRDVLARFTSVTTVQLNATPSRDHVSAICSGGEQIGSVGLHLPALQHVVVQGIVFSGMDSFDDSKQAWDSILSSLEQRKRDGRPIRFLTLCDEYTLRDAESKMAHQGVERYVKKRGGLADIKRHEEQYMSRAAELVEKVFDARGWLARGTRNVKWMEGRLTEFVQEL